MDYEYVAKREAENDKYWINYEKDFYYYKYNENYILPTILFCVIALFTSPIYIGIFGCIVLVIGALFLCHCNNLNLDNNPSVQKTRRDIRKYREDKKNGKLYRLLPFDIDEDLAFKWIEIYNEIKGDKKI